MGSGISVDDSLWPLFISRFSGPVSDGQFEEYLRRGTANLQRGELYVSVLDLGSVRLPTAAQRQRQMEWVKSQGRALREYQLGTAFIITSPVIRLGLSALFHLESPPFPYIAVPDMAMAVSWALHRLEQGGRGEDARRIREHLCLRGGCEAPPA